MTVQPRQDNLAVRWIRFRVLLVATGLLFGFLLLIGRSFQVQFFQWEGWASVANKQIRRDLHIEARRGEIYDRNGQELAVSIELESLAANPRAIKDPKGTAKKLAAVVEIPATRLRKKLRQHRAFVWLKHCLTPRQADAVRALGLEGIHFVKENRRYYPNVELAGHLLGFVGRDHIGLEGLEVAQDLLLGGESGTHPGAKDARGQIIYTHGLPAASDPQAYSLRLTLDKRIQYIAERELQKTVTDFGAKGGMTVVTEPKSGEILAMAVFPSFNPNSFSSSGPAVWRNRAVTDAFEPGSTFKIFLMAAALEEALVQPDDLFYCENGKYKVMNHTIHDLKKFGWLSLAQILRFSSNIGSAKVSEKLGPSRFYHYIRGFGFGAPTELGLPGETAGLIRPPDEWTPVDLAASSFGQSLSVSATQLAMALGAVANDGLLMQPLLIKEVLDAQGRVVRRNNSRVVRRVISATTAERLKDLLADVLTPGGTGARAALAQYQAAGKTGTAQKSSRKSGGYEDDSYTASFVGFAPVADPKILVVVVINEPQKGYYGGVVAAPAFRRIAQQTLHALQVPPEKTQNKGKNVATLDSIGSPSQSSATLQLVAYSQRQSNQPTVMPDLTGLSLRAALDRLQNFTGSLDIHGSGRVVGQNPEPGRNLSTISSCSLILAAD
ncbi:MAG: penicillin-binding protein [Syntrophobacteria bacterium]